MSRLYADENFPLPVVHALRAAGHDVVTLQETGRGSQGFSDPEVLAAATEDDRAVLTMNRKHFLRLHRERPQHAGIIACTFDNDFSGQATRISDSIRAAGGELRGKVIRVNRPG